MTSTDNEFESFKVTSYSFSSIYKNRSTRIVMYEILQEENQSQLFDFLEVADDFTYLKSSSLRRFKSKIIMNNFIDEDSKLDLKLPKELKKTIQNLYERNTQNENFFQPNLFKLAQDYILKLIKDEIFPKIFTNLNFQNCLKNQFEFFGMKEFQQKFLKSEETDCYKLICNTNYLIDTDLNFFPNIIPDDFSRDFINEIIGEMSKPFSGVKLQQQKNKKKKLCFLGLDGLNWVKKYTQIEESKLLREFFQQMIKRKFFIGVSIKNEIFDEKEFYSFGFKKRVVIVGNFLFLILIS